MSIEKLKSSLTDLKYVSGEYINFKSKFEFECSYGHKFVRSYRDIVYYNKSKCPICNSRHFDTNYVREVLQKDGYKLLSEYKNANSTILVECPNKHKSKMYYSNYSSGHRCRVCSDSKYTNQKVDEILAPSGYKRLGDYVGIFDKFDVICGEGHAYKMVMNDFNKGSRCPICKSSSLEIDFENEIKHLGLKYNVRDRQTVKGLELDFYFPDKKVAVEMHGSHWHSDQFLDKDYHKNKYESCRKLGITLIQILDTEWFLRKSQIVSYVKSKLNVYDRQLFARNCLLYQPNPTEVANFVNENHIQGYKSHQEAYGLKYEDELVGLITISRHHRNNKSFILNRLCVKRGVNVVGGIKKLFSSIPNKKGLITHADHRFTNGDLYISLGFVKSHTNKPDYMYVKNGKTRSKQSLRKTLLEKSTGKTESQLRKEQGYYRVWDAGKTCYVYN